MLTCILYHWSVVTLHHTHVFLLLLTFLPFLFSLFNISSLLFYPLLPRLSSHFSLFMSSFFTYYTAFVAICSSEVHHDFNNLMKPEMEFLDINSTKDSSLLLHAIHSLFYWRVFEYSCLFMNIIL